MDCLTIWSGSLLSHVVKVAHSWLLETCPGRMGVKHAIYRTFTLCPSPKTSPTQPHSQMEGQCLENATTPLKCLTKEAVGLWHPVWESQIFFCGRCPGHHGARVLCTNQAFNVQGTVGNVPTLPRHWGATCLLGEVVVRSTMLPKLLSNSLFQVILLPQLPK